MTEKNLIKETAPFLQFSSVKITDDFNPVFDILKIPNESLQEYCQKLINIAFSITHSQIPAFISHHCRLVKDPVQWLNKFEKLISVNEELFSGYRNPSRLMKLYTSIETKRNKIFDENSAKSKSKPPKKYINAESEERYFSFYEIKNKLQNVTSDSEKILLLTKEKFEYQQANIEFVNIHTLAFDKQCDKEIKQIYALKKLKDDLVKEGTFDKSPGTVFNKIKINVNINQITDVFYQLSREKSSDGKPYIEANTNEMAALIVNNFLDKDGNPISPQTVKTILKPSKEEKRPNTGKRIDLDKLI
ncbi:hypothetical protein CBW16_10305 [Flavobacteriaceae bacterium JJC]|uniref:hypothetical protein n=1 Tax=Kaistella soli TaxID=2849654 RepID=UPI000B4BF16C|nr:hypothetical protein [Kaistella soli]MBU8882372.1 hypothetical protein [Kaistella soli]OWK73143.1 hypothetical protein CBW16_10305 [Flavobacteriaceae bacterium JJC]